jgi:crotonobetainyl-CoA:carnitine CoA-transferase CaiB-like acyl-CoA transferase
MASLLSGIRVVENANVITGPLVGMILADLGADVIKIENPKGGDQFRGWDAGTAKVNLAFANYN